MVRQLLARKSLKFSHRTTKVDVGGVYAKMYPGAVSDERIKCISSRIEIESPKLMSSHILSKRGWNFRRLEEILNDRTRTLS